MFVWLHISQTPLWVFAAKVKRDVWGRAESRGNRARPVELMIMSNTCTTSRSRVPRRSSGSIKEGATTVQDERAPDLGFILCYVCGCRLWRAASSLCLFILLLKSLNVCRFPPPSSCIYKLCYIGAETREEGGRNRQTFKDFNYKINKHKRTQTWSSLVLHCRLSFFYPSGAPPWDSRPVRGAGVAHYH